MKHLLDFVNHRYAGHLARRILPWLAAAGLVLSCLPVTAHDGHVKYQVWVKGKGQTQVKFVQAAGLEGFRRKLLRLERRGWQLTDLEMKIGKTGTAWAGVFNPGEGKSKLEVHLNWDQFLTRSRQLEDRFHLADFDVANGPNGEVLFNGVWTSGTQDQEIRVDLDKNQFLQADLRLQGRQLYLADLEIYEKQGKPVYAGVWQRGIAPSTVVLDATWTHFHCRYHQLGGQGLRLRDFESLLGHQSRTSGSRALYAGIWRAGSGVEELKIKVQINDPTGTSNRKRRFGPLLIDYEIVEEHGHIESRHPLPSNCGESNHPGVAKSGFGGVPTAVTDGPRPVHTHSGTLHSGGSGGSGDSGG